MGTEERAIILDVGSGFTKAGFADEERPSFVFLSVIGRPKYPPALIGPRYKDYYVGEEALKLRGIMRISYPLEHGVVKDWDGFKKLLEFAFMECLRIDPAKHSILMTEPPLNPRDCRERIAEIIGEKTINFYFGKDISKFGYGWAFPKRNVISLGWGCLLSEITNTRNAFEKFLEYEPVKEILSSGETIRTSAHLVPLKSRDTFIEKGVLAVGDAAGLVDPISGKGIPYALESGELAAKTIINALDEGSLEGLCDYEDALKDSFLPVLKAKYDIVFDVYKNDESIMRYLELWQKHRASEIAQKLWKRL